MKKNYPVVYALMPIIEFYRNNQANIMTKNVCYIISKCYLVGEKTTFKENGKEITNYEIVFPYQQRDNEWKYEEPIFNLINDQCVNSYYTDVIFDSYDKAVTYKNQKNKELCEEILFNLPVTENFQEIVHQKKEEFYDKLNKYELLEKQILNSMSKLNNECRKELVNVKRADGKVLPMDLYQFINLFENEKYLVYSITKEEYDLLTNQSVKEIKMYSQKPILLNDSKVSKLINDDTKGCYYFDNNWLKFSKKMSPVSNDEIDNISKDAIVIYTTETVEDIINSYQTYDNINLHELEKQQDKSNKKLIKK